TVCVVGKMRDLILQLSKSSIYSTKPNDDGTTSNSMPNAFGGEDTYLSNGKWKSTISDESGVMTPIY
ncbi:hypothetical protein ACJWSO_27485, partial [Klebsiella pneumoniae]